jgi:histidinol-phosphate/aromatic aminotransferase/cobyric acid decarboxylase-like protein
MSLRVHGDALVGDGLLDFAVNVWPGERPPELEQALRRALADRRYPDQRRARAAVAARHDREVDEVLLLNGAAEGLWLIAQTLRPARAAVVHPSFTESELALRAAGADVVRVFRDPRDWSLDPGSVPRDAELVVVGNPNNPTGTVDPPLAAPGLVVVDGSFADFVPFDPEGDVVIRSLTKLWSLAGVRAGYLLGPRELVERLESNRQPWSVNAIACAAIELAAGDRATPARVAREVRAARERLIAGLAALGVRVWPSAVNFLLLELDDAARVAAALRARGIAVRPCDSFPGLDDGRHLRVAVRTEDDNDRLVELMAEVV